MNSDLIKLFQNIVEELPIGFLMYDTNNTILVANKEIEKLCKISRNKIIGQNLSVKDKQGTETWFLTQIMFPSLAPKMTPISEAREYPQVVDISFPEPRLVLRTSTVKLFGEDGTIKAFVKVIEDKTREAVIFESKHEFVSLVSHQLRTPLTAVNWTFQLLLKDGLSDSQKNVAETGARAANELVSRIDDTVEVAKIEDGRFDYKFSPVNVVGIVEEVIERASLMAGQYNVTISADIEKEEISLTADKHKLGVAIANIVDNAMKYGAGKAVLINVRELFEKHAVSIKVQDFGIGISSSDRENLFNKFFRAENARKVQPDGNGLGLFIAKNIIESHSGTVKVESKLGEGSIFTIHLPINPKEISSLKGAKQDAGAS